MMFGDQTDQAEAAASWPHAHAQGVNFIDTADVYTKGASEEMVGKLIQPHRHDWVLATKLGNAMSSAQRGALFAQLDAARGRRQPARLQTDHIDILYLHRDYRRHGPGRAAARAGTTWCAPARSATGACRTSAAGASPRWCTAPRQLGMPGPVVCQPYYNLLNRMPEVEILPACHHHGIGVVPYSPIARGVLTGKYLPGRRSPPRAPAPAAATSA
jgi:aryl-alcohol dehydrogenase-like predicted oxidoreductase